MEPPSHPFCGRSPYYSANTDFPHLHGRNVALPHLCLLGHVTYCSQLGVAVMWGEQRLEMCLHTNLGFLVLGNQALKQTYVRADLTYPVAWIKSPACSGDLQLTLRTVRINYCCPKVLILEVDFFFRYGGNSWCIYYYFIPWYRFTCCIWVILCNESPRWFSCLIWGKRIPSFPKCFPHPGVQI